MKNKCNVHFVRLIGIIVLVAVIVFGMAACGDDDNGGGGMTWKIADLSLSYSSNISIAYGNGKFVMASSDWVYTSPNGINWSEGTLPASFYPQTIAFGGDKFIIGGSSGKMAYSSDGTNWTPVADSKFGSDSINAITWGDASQKFVAVGGYSTRGRMAYSPDGVTWTEITGIPFDGPVDTIAWGSEEGERFIAGGSNTVLAYSYDSLYNPNGITVWTPIQNENAPHGRTKVIWGKDKFVMIGERSLEYSSNGLQDWKSGNTQNLWLIDDIAYGGGKFVVVGNGGIGSDFYSGAYSSDGITWKYQDTIMKINPEGGWTPINCTAIAYGNGTFVAAGSGAVIYSTGN